MGMCAVGGLRGLVQRRCYALVRLWAHWSCRWPMLSVVARRYYLSDAREKRVVSVANTSSGSKACGRRVTLHEMIILIKTPTKRREVVGISYRHFLKSALVTYSSSKCKPKARGELACAHVDTPRVTRITASAFRAATVRTSPEGRRATPAVCRPTLN